MLLRAGQTPFEPRLVSGARRAADRKRATSANGWAAATRATPPDTWTESGQTPILPKVSSSRDPGGTRRSAHADGGRMRAIRSFLRCVNPRRLCPIATWSKDLRFSAPALTAQDSVRKAAVPHRCWLQMPRALCGARKS